MRISTRLSSIPESPTLAITARAAELRAEGADVISLSAGEPDFPTPNLAREAGIRAIEEGQTRYTAVAGLPALRKELQRSLERDFGLSYELEELCITPSTKPAIFLSLLALLEPGDEVVVLAPYWVSYPAIVNFVGGKVHLVETQESTGFLPTQTQLETALSRKDVRAILLNSPCNPSGAVWPRDRIEDLVARCEKHNVTIVSDEIYAQILFDGIEHVSPAQVPGGHERCAVLNGFSKAYAMTGWRLGWMAAPKALTSAVIRAQSHLMGNASSISQAAGILALADPVAEDVQAMAGAFARRRTRMLEGLAALPGFSIVPPRGAFYLLPGVHRILDHLSCDDVELAKLLLDEALLAVVPGTAFGLPGHIRLSYAASDQDLERALERLRTWTRERGLTEL